MAAAERISHGCEFEPLRLPSRFAFKFAPLGGEFLQEAQPRTLAGMTGDPVLVAPYSAAPLLHPCLQPTTTNRVAYHALCNLQANQQRNYVIVAIMFPLADIPRSYSERQHAMPMRQFYGDRVRNEGHADFAGSRRLADAS